MRFIDYAQIQSLACRVRRHLLVLLSCGYRFPFDLARFLYFQAFRYDAQERQARCDKNKFAVPVCPDSRSPSKNRASARSRKHGRVYQEGWFSFVIDLQGGRCNLPSYNRRQIFFIVKTIGIAYEEYIFYGIIVLFDLAGRRYVAATNGRYESTIADRSRVAIFNPDVDQRSYGRNGNIRVRVWMTVPDVFESFDRDLDALAQQRILVSVVFD